jgi:hypothetical protein
LRETRKNDPKWIYPHEIFNTENIAGFAEELAKKLDKNELFTRIYDNARRIQDILNIDVPVIKINTSLENVATIFERLNNAGTRIKQADVTLSYIAAYNEGWIRERFMKYREDLDEEGFPFDPTLLIRAITSVGEDKAVLRDVKEDFLRNRDGSLDEAFSNFKTSLNELIQEFRNIGVLSSKLIYAKNTIIPLIYLHNKFRDHFDFKKSLFFFLSALWRGRYSGSAETTLQEDINKIKNAESFDDAIVKLIKELNITQVTEDMINNAIHYQGEGRFFKLILYLIAYKNEAVDWFTKDRLGFTRRNEVNKDFTFEEHHFFPRRILGSIGVEKDKRELLANITFINPGTNKRLRYEPYTYIQKYNIINCCN